MAIDLSHFRYFVAVAEELHFHRAAKRLGVAQPALSRTIKNLENALGVTLLERSIRIVALSNAGKSFLIGCRESLGYPEKIIEDAQRIHQGNIGTLRIGYTDFAMNGRLPSLLKAFRDQTPDIALLSTHSVTSEQLNQLEEGTIDFGFATGTVSTVAESLPPGLVVIPIEDVNDRLHTIAVWPTDLNNVAKDRFVSF